MSLLTFIREVLDLDAVPADVAIPNQDPLRLLAGVRGLDGASVRAAPAQGSEVASAVMAQAQVVRPCLTALRTARAGPTLLPMPGQEV